MTSKSDGKMDEKKHVAKIDAGAENKLMSRAAQIHGFEVYSFLLDMEATEVKNKDTKLLDFSRKLFFQLLREQTTTTKMINWVQNGVPEKLICR